MCGIVGYIGKPKDIHEGLEALKRLEYRGYDSAGMAAYDPGQKEILCVKAVGKIENLEKRVKGIDIKASPSLFYTRWATHGGVTEQNCHPHADCKGNIWVAHNGIIENYQQLKEKLIEQGHTFVSETDTEVIPHLIEHAFRGDLAKAVREVVPLLKGAFALVIIAKDDPEQLIAVRNSAPLLIGVGKGEYIVASDPSAVVGITKEVVYLADGEMAVIKKDGYAVQDIDGNHVKKTVDVIDWKIEDAQKGGYEHFMLKEIMEQPEGIADTLRGRFGERVGEVKLGGLEQVAKRLNAIERVHIIGMGTAYLAGLVGEYLISGYAKVPADTDTASEFRYRSPIIDDKTAYIFISQSGETADTLGALKEVKRQGGLTLGIINVVGSSVAREVHAGLYNHVGPEIGVASTKVFTSQLTLLALLAVFFANQKGTLLPELTEELKKIPETAERFLQDTKSVQQLAEKYAKVDSMLYIGRKYQYPIALEGALKLKEISYVHAEGFSGGELKHGPIALIDERIPTLALCPKDSVYEKMISNIQEVKARKGPIIAVATEGDKEIAKIADDVLYIPRVPEPLMPLISVIPLQLFAYYMAVLRGHDPDKPRNLAKSVTVE
ncbi:MAG: glutamine--fructose-6-phosphate aminotransferase [Candidatus Wildermuthbacteria bacterium RIFCSPLOWO2_01_FULL_48_29]|uniref:Glutamine--fructose-6-phosphate aminotransferase [isomerizing] n=2 Tax=Candidatus Wildermuthiibacteriota TaxID=1817923 RepID=A0A1G2RMR3_9BACT|nr:MAG: glutamine--fructose-6-phosphate aminotransferase [Candidatus Wildermuthbacteria bacterium RIFCSPHIGHO2_01_FULL_48_27b]OHA73572.1 MAG: glutamine--fructose-6-phosphate aminotransferase [Candidatus Wildermuthbacteria bacterium RIFCSPLOWO2_01_FULL_48_29]